MLSPPPAGVDTLRWGVDHLSDLNHMDVYTTDTTQAKCWTLSKDQAQDEDLGQSSFAKKLSCIVRHLSEGATGYNCWAHTS